MSVIEIEKKIKNWTDRDKYLDEKNQEKKTNNKLKVERTFLKKASKLELFYSTYPSILWNRYKLKLAERN